MLLQYYHRNLDIVILRKRLIVNIWNKKNHKYLFGRHFEVYTDSLPVKLIFNAKKALPSTAHPRLLRWALFLSGYNYTIHYSKNVQVADCLSRLPDKDTSTGDSEISQCYTINLRSESPLLHEFNREMQNDPVLNQIYL